MNDTNESKPILDEMLRNSPGGVYRCRLKPHFHIDFVSDGYCRMLGYTSKELQGLLQDDMSPVIFSADRNDFFDNLSRLGETLKTTTFNYRFVHKDGNIRYVMDTIRPVVEDNGDVYCYAQSTDITELHKKEEIIRIVAQHSGRVVYLFDSVSRTVNPVDSEDSSLFRFPKMSPEFPESMIECGSVLAESVDDIRALYNDIAAGSESGRTRLHMRLPDSTEHWFDVKYTSIFDGGKAPSYTVISYLDITRQHEQELAYMRYVQNVNSLKEDEVMSYESDLTADIVERQNRGKLWQAINIIGMKNDDAVQKLKETYLASVDRDKLPSRQSMLAMYEGGTHDITMRFSAIFTDGKRHWISCNRYMLEDPYTSHIKLYVSVRDVTAEKVEELEVLNRAERDGMTGIYNRATAEKLIRDALSDRRKKSCAFLMIDLDNLKYINDNFGHSSGDTAIKGIAEALRSKLRKTDIFGRAGGDEFIALLTDISSAHAVRTIVQEIMKKVSAVNIGEFGGIPIRCSVGGTFGMTGEDDFDTLYRKADLALYHVKRNGKNDFSFYTDEMERDDYHYISRAGVTLRQQAGSEPFELKKLLTAISIYFPLVISVNLTRNSYYMMEYDDFATHKSPDIGEYDYLIETGAATFHPDDRQSFIDLFSRENLIQAYLDGKRSVTHIGMQLSDSGEYRRMNTTVILMRDETTGDICEISFAHSIIHESLIGDELAY